MTETTWMFGTTSDLSKEIIKNLDNPICFGRHNVDYSDPDKFIKEHVVDNTPVNICVNVNQGTNELGKISDTVEGWRLAFDRAIINIFFFHKLLIMTARIKKPVKVCYITSSFPNTSKFDGIKNKKGKKEDDLIFKLNKTVTKPYVNSFLYGSFRAMQQFGYLSRHNEFCKTVGVSPSKISDENLSEYAKTIAKLLDKDIESPQWGKIYDLSSNCWFDFELD